MRLLLGIPILAGARKGCTSFAKKGFICGAAMMRSVLIAVLSAAILLISSADAFSNIEPTRYTNNAAKLSPRQPSSSFAALSASSNDDEGDGGEDKFSFAQRIESLKCAVVGAVSGSLCVTLPAAYHHLLYSDTLSVNGMAQWEFDTDMGAIEGALFAIVYRYAIRGDDNPMLNQGAVGAFVLVRTLSRISTPTSCSALPLSCGAPLGYVNWDMINQGLLSGVESAALFGGAALAMEFAFDKGFIGKFR